MFRFRNNFGELARLVECERIDANGVRNTSIEAEESEILTQANRRMPRTVLLRGARQLVTLRGEHRPRHGAEMSALGIIQDGALLIVDGVIREVGPSRRVERLIEARRAEEIDASGKVVLPGFVDCVTRPLHPIATAAMVDERCRRGNLGEIGDRMVNSSASLKAFSAQRLEADARKHLRQFLAQGTLTMAASPGWDDDERTSIKALRVFRELGPGAVRVVPAVAVGATASADLLERVRQGRLAALASIDARHAEAWLMARRARELGFTLRIHGSAELALQGGAAMFTGSPEAATGWTPELSAGLREAGVVWVVCPAVDRLCGRAPAPLRAGIDSGLAVALATGFGIDASATSSLAAVMNLACLDLRMTPAEAITATTINAAFALNVADEVGSLAPGKAADLLLMDAADYREVPMQMGSNLVHTLVRRGECEAVAPAAMRLGPRSAVGTGEERIPPARAS